MAPDTDLVLVAPAYQDALTALHQAHLAADLGFDAVDAGPLRNARYLEPLAALNIYLGYGAGHGTSIAPVSLGL